MNFLEALPHFEVQKEAESEPRALMRPEPPEDLKPLGGTLVKFGGSWSKLEKIP